MTTERNRLYRNLKESWSGMKSKKTQILFEGIFDDTGQVPTSDVIVQLLQNQLPNVDVESAQLAGEVIEKMFTGTLVTAQDIKKKVMANPKVGPYIKVAIKAYDPELFDKMMQHVEKFQHADDPSVRDDPEDELAFWQSFLGGSIKGTEVSGMEDYKSQSPEEQAGERKTLAKDQLRRKEQEREVQSAFQAGDMDIETAINALRSVHGTQDQKLSPAVRKELERFLKQGMEQEMEFGRTEVPEVPEDTAAIAESKKYSGFKNTNIDKKHRLLKEAWNRMGECSAN